MAVFLVLVVVWAVVLLPPALRAHGARQEAFLVSLGSTPAPDVPHPAEPRAVQVQRRRRIAGGLLFAMATTLLMGLLPTFRTLLYVHLFLVDSFIAYVALLAHNANRAGRAAVEPAVTVAPAEVEPVAAVERARRWRRGRVPVLPELPVAPIG